MAYLIRIEYPLNGLKYHLSDVDVANFNIHGTQEQQFPIWKILIEETSSLSNRTML